MHLLVSAPVRGDARSILEGEGLEVKVRHSTSMLEALITGTIVWTRDPDYGDEVVDIDTPENAALLALVSPEILQPRRWFGAHGRLSDDRAWVNRMKAERKALLRKFECDPAVVESIGSATRALRRFQVHDDPHLAEWVGLSWLG